MRVGGEVDGTGSEPYWCTDFLACSAKPSWLVLPNLLAALLEFGL
jgi:hypothetical protein